MLSYTNTTREESQPSAVIALDPSDAVLETSLRMIQIPVSIWTLAEEEEEEINAGGFNFYIFS